MTSRVAFPFFTLSDDAVQAEPWELALNEGEFGPVSDYLPDWDTASSIRARRSLRIDVALAAAEIGVELNDLHLAAVASGRHRKRKTPSLHTSLSGTGCG